MIHKTGFAQRISLCLIHSTLVKVKLPILQALVLLLFLSRANAQTHLQWVTDELSQNQLSNEVNATGTATNGTTYCVNKEQNNVFPMWTVNRFIAYDTNGNKLWQYNNDTCFTDCQELYSNVIPLGTNGAVFIGTYSDSTGMLAMQMKRFDAGGNLLWYRQISYPQLQPWAPLIARLDNHGDMVMGFSFYTLTDLENFVFAKYDTIAGNELWHFQLPDQGPAGISLQETCVGLEIDTNNNLYFIGNGDSGPATIFRRYYFSVSPAGAINYFGYTNTNPLIGLTHDVCMDGAGSIYLLLSFNNSMAVFKQDTAGGIFQWTVALQHDSAKTQFVQLEADSFHVYALANFTYFYPDSTFAGGTWNNNHYYLTKIDTGGNIVWQKDYFTAYNRYSPNSNVGGADHMVICHNQLYVSSTSLIDSTGFKTVLHKIDSAGNTVWIDTTITEPAVPLNYDADCNIYFSGNTQDTSSNGYTFMRTQKFSDVSLSIAQYPATADELQVYPNPVRNTVTLQLKNQADAFLYIHVYNSIGQLVYEDRRNENKTLLPLKNLTEGVYFISTRTKCGYYPGKKIVLTAN